MNYTLSLALAFLLSVAVLNFGSIWVIEYFIGG